jgi:hypothetical protein
LIFFKRETSSSMRRPNSSNVSMGVLAAPGSRYKPANSVL